MTNQPLVVFVGPITNVVSYLVIVENTRYAMPTALKAVDLCFKSFFALNLKYPTECRHVWTFLQTYVYSIQGQGEQSFVSVNRFISLLDA